MLASPQIRKLKFPLSCFFLLSLAILLNGCGGYMPEEPTNESLRIGTFNANSNPISLVGMIAVTIFPSLLASM